MYAKALLKGVCPVTKCVIKVTDIKGNFMTFKPPDDRGRLQTFPKDIIWKHFEKKSIVIIHGLVVG